MRSSQPGLPHYTVRESSRSKRVRLRVTAENGLEVVVPRGYDHRKIPDLVEEKRGWIARATERVAPLRERLDSHDPFEVPDTLELPGIGRNVSVTYRPTASSRVTAAEATHGHLVVSGATEDAQAVHRALRRWIARTARVHFAERIAVLSERSNLAASRLTVRWQRRRWGSCSSTGSISLNAKLLFLPPEIADHVILHELCHLRRPDHSKAFYALLAKYDPSWRQHRAALREAWRNVPVWADI